MQNTQAFGTHLVCCAFTAVKDSSVHAALQQTHSKAKLATLGDQSFKKWLTGGQDQQCTLAPVQHTVLHGCLVDPEQARHNQR
jgi:hypothetical protein